MDLPEPHEGQHLPDTRGVLVEMIGPQGIGKTTTVMAIPRELRRRWLLRTRFERMGGDQLEPARTAFHPSLPVYRDLLGLRMAHMSASTLGAYALARAIRIDAMFVMRDIYLRAMPHARGLLLDEGLLQVFAKQFSDLPDPSAHALLEGRGIVVILPDDPLTSVARIRARQAETGRLVEPHIGLDDAALERWAARQLEPMAAFAAQAERLGIPVLRLRAEDARADNAHALAAFAFGLAALRNGPGNGAAENRKARGGISDAGLSSG